MQTLMLFIVGVKPKKEAFGHGRTFSSVYLGVILSTTFSETFCVCEWAVCSTQGPRKIERLSVLSGPSPLAAGTRPKAIQKTFSYTFEKIKVSEGSTYSA